MSHEHLAERLKAVSHLGRFEGPVLERLERFVTESSELELFRTNPVRFAKQTGVGENDAIDLFLQATHAGIFDISWGVLCPGCASFITAPAGLRTLTQRKRCELCQADVEVDLDERVEVAFTVSPAVRRTRFHKPDGLDFGVDGFALAFSRSAVHKPEFSTLVLDGIVGSKPLAAGATVEFDVELREGRYAVMTPARHVVRYVRVRSTATAHAISLDLLESGYVGDTVELAPGRSTIRISNRLVEPVLVGIFRTPVPAPEERVGPAPTPGQFYTLSPFLSGKRLLSSQTFRDLFRAQSVPGAGGLALKSLTLLFTDLKGSTEMYERVGDFKAYDLVQQHFDILREVVTRGGGAVVKTMGDAIMASFSEPAPALEAAIHMNRDIRTVGSGEDLLLKIGLHAGPCIAVDSNDRLDYFGQTVNVAARVQGIANASEIVCTEPIFSASGAKDVITSHALKAKRESASLKGVDGQVTVYRLG